MSSCTSLTSDTTVIVKSLWGEEHSLCMSTGTTMFSFKQMIHRQFSNGFPDGGTLVFKNQKLLGDDTPLFDYGIVTGDTVYLVPNLRGGGPH